MIGFFVRISPLYRARFQNPHWNKYPNAETDKVEAICLFLGGYAFERQGRDPSYAHAAVTAIQEAIEEAIEEARIQPGLPIDETVKQTVWNRFSESLQGQNLNQERNPLCHVYGNGCKCIWCVFNDQNIISVATQSLRNGQVEQIWNRFQDIRGVGPKIASFFLRDLAVKYELAPIQGRHLLQPVDVWVRRTVHQLANNNGMGDKQIAQWIVGHCREPEFASQGIWYFGAQIAQSEFRLCKALKNQKYAKELVKDHLRTLEATVAVARRVNRCR